MDDPSSRADTRALTETFAVGVLIGLTLLMTVSVGIYVVAVSEDEGGTPTIEFAYSYNGGADSLLVTHESGDPVPAGSLILENRDSRVTWAEVASMGTNETVEPGDSIILSRRSAWGENVGTTTQIRIYYAPADGNRTRLATWSR